MATPREHLDAGIAQLRDTHANGEPMYPKIYVEREGDLVAVGTNFDIKDMTRVAALMLGAYGGEAAVTINDGWVYEGPQLKGDDRPPADLFRDKVPGASEALMVQYVTAEGQRFMQANYTRSKKVIRVTKIYDSADHDHQRVGRAIFKQEDLVEAVQRGRLLVEVMQLLEMNRNVADTIITKVLGRILVGHAQVGAFIPLAPNEVDEFNAYCKDNGLESILVTGDEDD